MFRFIVSIILLGCLLSAFVSFSLSSSLDQLGPKHHGPPTLPKLLQHNQGLPLSPEERLGRLVCDKYGGPLEHVAKEMVYWQDIASDAKFISPFYERNVKQYLTFEPDEGGFNNIRQAYEVVISLAHAMGRTLVLVRSRAGFVDHSAFVLLN